MRLIIYVNDACANSGYQALLSPEGPGYEATCSDASECSLTMAKGTVTSIRDIVKQAAASFGVLKQEQEESIVQLVSGKDVFVSLPTGFGKSLCYILLPHVFDLWIMDGKKSIVLVVSPLVALMKDQVAVLSPALFICDSL